MDRAYRTYLKMKDSLTVIKMQGDLLEIQSRLSPAIEPAELVWASERIARHVERVNSLLEELLGKNAQASRGWEDPGTEE